jgi:hypothetical protein
MGPLCETCDFYGESVIGVKYFKVSNFNCERCDKIQNNFGKSIAFALVSLILLFYSLKMTYSGVIESI